MDSKIAACPWDPIHDFRSYAEFDRFVEWMNTQIASGIAEEISVSSHYIGSTSLSEKWFKHVGSGIVWRLVWPDPPFTGVFEPV